MQAATLFFLSFVTFASYLKIHKSKFCKAFILSNTNLEVSNQRPCKFLFLNKI